jgi:hypothetical protein
MKSESLEISPDINIFKFFKEIVMLIARLETTTLMGEAQIHTQTHTRRHTHTHTHTHTYTHTHTHTDSLMPWLIM